MAQCWERRGCDEEMMSRCPHNTPGERCPADCHFAACHRPTHHVTMDPALIFRVDLDREHCMKDICPGEPGTPTTKRWPQASRPKRCGMSQSTKERTKFRCPIGNAGHGRG